MSYVQRLQKLFVGKSKAKGVVCISYLKDGIAIAISDFVDDNKPTLKHCEFIPTLQLNDHVQILRDFVALYNLAHYDCHLVLTVDNYRRVNIEAPAVADNEIAGAIYWKIADLFDFPIDQAFVDYYDLPLSTRDSSHKMLEVIACPKELIQNLADTSLRAGLKVNVVDIQETTLRNLATLLPDNKNGVAVFILHEFSGAMLIQKNGVIYHFRNFDIGFSELDLAAQHSGDYNRSHSEKDNLALEIRRSLDYAESYYGITPISGLAIIPLMANTQELLTLLNDTMGITAKVMDISALMGCDTILDDVSQAKCSGVIGATLREWVSAL
jgi:MSHA biogenesis protein MshI